MMLSPSNVHSSLQLTLIGCLQLTSNSSLLYQSLCLKTSIAVPSSLRTSNSPLDLHHSFVQDKISLYCSAVFSNICFSTRKDNRMFKRSPYSSTEPIAELYSCCLAVHLQYRCKSLLNSIDQTPFYS